MRKILTPSAAMAALLLTTAAQAGTLLAIVPVSGSSSTNVFGINDSDTIDGSYIGGDGLEHGYVGPVDGSNYTTFDAPAGSTEPRAIASDGTIAGFANNDGTPNDFIPFERTPDGTITSITKKKKPLNYLVQGVANTTDQFAGSYFTKQLALVGYLGKNGTYVSAVSLSIANEGVAPRAVDSAGDVVGWYYDTNGVQNGFLLSGGTATTVDYPDDSEVSTVLEGINDSGTITGQWTDTDGVVHAFTYTVAGGKFKSITVPGSTSFTQAWGINTVGDVAIGSDAGYFIYCPKKKNCAGTGIEADERETVVPLEKLPHTPCVDRCLAPLSANETRPASPSPKTVAAQRADGRPQPLQP